jgi:hypothetical protein
VTVRAARFQWTRISLAVFVLSSLLLSVTAQTLFINPPANVHAQPVDPPTTIAPSTVWGPLFGTSGDVEIDVNRTGIAVRVEIPREFLEGVISSDNDTHFIESNIRNDYYYYSVVDESRQWSYNGTANGPCFKANFSLRDPNAPWCVEIWNYLNDPNYKAPINAFDYCANKFDNGTAGPPGIRYVFSCFSSPKFIRFHNLNSPSVAGIYNFTLFVATQTNSLGYPDFVDAWHRTLHVPVSMRDRPASIGGQICDSWFSFIPSCPPILGTKGIAYAKDVDSGQIVGRSYVDETTGLFNITGLAAAPTGTSYQILASAGFDPTYDTAYSLTVGPTVTVNTGQNQAGEVVPLDRAPEVCGIISYFYGAASLTQSLTDHPYLPATGLKVLNITVEGDDSQQHVYRNMTLSQNTGSDDFKLITGSDVSYVGTDPYGTEFAGLPPANSSSTYVLNLNVWITGYLQVNLDGSPETVTVTESSSPQPGSPTPCPTPFPNPIKMQVGGAISGTIQLWNEQILETPDQAETSLPRPLPPTDALFGGNILIQAKDHSGILRGVAVLNGTLPDGRTCYASPTLSTLCKIKVIQVTSGTGPQLELAFTIIGFSEYLNHTWSGVWGEKDYGLPPDQTSEGYSIQVFIRGYEMQTTNPIQLSLGGYVGNVAIKMVRGGAFQVGVVSYDNRFGTRATQAPQTFQFLSLSIPVRARTYFYDSSGFFIGYVECIIRTGVTQPDRLCQMGLQNAQGVLPGSEQNSFTVIFAGQNWSVRDILFFDDVPTYVGTSSNDMYTIKTYTLGYVWEYGPSQAQNTLLGFTPVSIPLLIGDEIDITSPLVNQVLGTLPENDYAIGQALLNGGLSGAVPGNFTEGTLTLSFPIFGFGGMINSTKVIVAGGPPTFPEELEGQGHFFYVRPDGTHFNCDYNTNCYFDYGLDNDTYNAQVPEFGFDWHFMQPVPPSTITFNDLFLETGVVIEDILMSTFISISVFGQADLPTFTIAPLTWVQVTASNSTFTRTVTTLDGDYVGPGALFLPPGTYNITFSEPAYYTPQTVKLVVQQWGQGYPSGYPIDPPNATLCPILPPATTCGS